MTPEPFASSDLLQSDDVLAKADSTPTAGPAQRLASRLRRVLPEEDSGRAAGEGLAGEDVEEMEPALGLEPRTC
jgi:hypothetical protein